MAVLKFTNSKGSLKKILAYVTQDRKTEEALVSGIGCMAETAYDEMTATRNIYRKPGGRQYIHLVQSFAPDDPLTHQKAHEIGRQLAARFPGFQCVVATHKDRQHIHNHVVICSVNYETGLKFQQSKKDMQAAKDYSDTLCKAAGLSVIPPGRKGKYRKISEYKLEEKGSVTWRDILKNDIDDVLATTFSFKTFLEDMERRGYTIKQGKNLAFMPNGGERFIRLRSLGEGYTEQAIRGRLDTGSIVATLHRTQKGARRLAPKADILARPAPPKLKGFRALYWKYLYLLGKVKKQQAPRFVSTELKAELVKLEQYSKQFQMLNRYGVETHEQLDALEIRLKDCIADLVKQRAATPDDATKKALTKQLRSLRADVGSISDVRIISSEIEERTYHLLDMHHDFQQHQRKRQPPQQHR